MLCFTNNTVNVVPSVLDSISNDGKTKRTNWRSDSQLKSRSNTTLMMNPRLFIGLELSLVPQVEKVFVECLDQGKEFRVLTVVNDRDAAVRSQIYRREQAVMGEFKYSDFDFQIIERQGRCLAEMLNPAGELAYKR